MSRSRPLAALVVLAALAGACATLPPCPARGGPAWTEWTSTHFKLYTDLDAEDGLAALRDFEELRHALLFAAWRDAPEPSGRTTVFVLRSSAERRVFLPGRYIAAVVGSPALRTSYIIKDGTDRDETVTHCLAAMLERHFGLHGKATWFDEGLAYYLDSLRLERDGSASWGEVHPGFYRSVAHGYRLPFEQLWQPVAPELEAGFSATSWLAVHYLFNHERGALTEFQRRLAGGQDGASAWRAAFPTLTPAVMDERLTSYVFDHGEYRSFEARIPRVTYTSSAKPLDDAAVHALRALLFATNVKTPAATRPSRVRAEIAESLKLDPLQPWAIFVQRFWLGDDASDVEVPKRLIARRPDDALGWLILARARAARHETTEAAEAMEQVNALAGLADTPLELDVRVANPGPD